MKLTITAEYPCGATTKDTAHSVWRVFWMNDGDIGKCPVHGWKCGNKAIDRKTIVRLLLYAAFFLAGALVWATKP